MVRFSPDIALQQFEDAIKEAWLCVRPRRADAARQMRSHQGNEPISVALAGGSGGDGFACHPSLGVITLKWWAVEVLWLTTYAFQVLGSRLLRLAENGDEQVQLEADPKLQGARDAIAQAALILERQESVGWGASAPHPQDPDPEAKRAYKVFLAALAWIQLHEVQHIILDRSTIADRPDADCEEERLCDAYATHWFRQDVVRSAKHEADGVAVAVFFLALRAVLWGPSPRTHPSAKERFEAAKVTPRNAARIALVVDILLQSGAHSTPATDRKTFDRESYASAVFERLEVVLEQASTDTKTPALI